MRRIGSAIAAQVLASRPDKSKDRPRILIGRDTRESGPALEREIAAGIHAQGVDTLHVGVLPTPAIGRLTRELGAEAGIVVSASHNSAEYNGVKVFGRDGFKIDDRAQEEIEARVEGTGVVAFRPRSARAGGSTSIRDAEERYRSFLLSTLPKGLRLDGFKIVIDCANGAASGIAPAIFRELGATVVTLADRPDGSNINRECGSEHPDSLRRAVLEERADCGIAFDGDSDRIVMSDEKGRLIDGDQLMTIGARAMKDRGLIGGDEIVGTVMNNVGLEPALASLGLRLIRTGVGDRLVAEELRRRGLGFGGEPNGHLMFLAFGASDDGILAGLQILSLAAEKKAALSELASAMQPVPQILIGVPVERRSPISEQPALCAAIEAAEAELKGVGRVLVRYSGTEPKLRIMVEGPDPEVIRTIADRIARVAIKRAG
jgi:phosphoglucosamine mutase